MKKEIAAFAKKWGMSIKEAADWLLSMGVQRAKALETYAKKSKAKKGKKPSKAKGKAKATPKKSKPARAKGKAAPKKNTKKRPTKAKAKETGPIMNDTHPQPSELN